MFGYEAQTIGNGLKGYYYDNEIFKGDYVKKIDTKIDMIWT